MLVVTKLILIITNEEIIRRFNEVHKGKYIYDKVEYYSMNREVDIICPKHGIFLCTPHNHLYNNYSK